MYRAQVAGLFQAVAYLHPSPILCLDPLGSTDVGAVFYQPGSFLRQNINKVSGHRVNVDIHLFNFYKCSSQSLSDNSLVY